MRLLLLKERLAISDINVISKCSRRHRHSANFIAWIAATEVKYCGQVNYNLQRRLGELWVR